jgi:hypothetical protein
MAMFTGAVGRPNRPIEVGGSLPGPREKREPWGPLESAESRSMIRSRGEQSRETRKAQLKRTASGAREPAEVLHVTRSVKRE